MCISVTYLGKNYVFFYQFLESMSCKWQVQARVLWRSLKMFAITQRKNVLVNYFGLDQSHRVLHIYLSSRKLWFRQHAEENVLWISLERFNIFGQTKQDWFLKKWWNSTYCFVFFHNFASHSDVHLSIKWPRQCCVALLPLVRSDSFSTSCEETTEVTVHIIIPPTIMSSIVCICVGTSLEENVAKEQFPPAKMCRTFRSPAAPGTEYKWNLPEKLFSTFTLYHSLQQCTLWELNR